MLYGVATVAVDFKSRLKVSLKGLQYTLKHLFSVEAEKNYDTHEVTGRVMETNYHIDVQSNIGLRTYCTGLNVDRECKR